MFLLHLVSRIQETVFSILVAKVGILIFLVNAAHISDFSNNLLKDKEKKNPDSLLVEHLDANF